MIGEPRYSIKNVEHIYRGKRDTDVASGGESIIVYEGWAENPDGDTWQTSKTLRSIRDYNIDDCDSTLELTQWLREEQAKHKISYLVPDGEGEKEVPDAVTEITQLRDELLTRTENEPDLERAALLDVLAWSLEFHRRENKPTWWRLYERLGATEMDLYDDMDCLAGLTRTGTEAYKPPKARHFVYEYAYEKEQPFKGAAKTYHVVGEDNFKITRKDYDPEAGLICLLYTSPSPRDRTRSRMPSSA